MPNPPKNPSATDSLCDRPATELLALLDGKHASAEEVVRAHIDRIERVNTTLNAVVVRRFDAAIDEAKAVDRRRVAGAPLGPMAGLPVTVKECLDLEGTPSTFGLDHRKEHRAERDETHVARWRDADAVVLAKTNVSQLLVFLETDNPVYGRTIHPTNAERSPGGSSGGEAATIAAGGSCLGLGTDIGGSSRVPAAFCGIVGFKPTAGRLPDHGRFSFSPGQQAIASQVGVLGRTVGDVALGLNVANGSGPGARPMPDHARSEIRGLRIAMYTDDGLFTPCPTAKRAVLEAADALTIAGAEIVEWTPPDLGEAAVLAFWLLAHDGGRGLRDALHGSRKDPRVKQMLALGRLPNRVLTLARGLLGATGQKSLAEATRLFAPPGKGRTIDYWHLTDARDAYAARFHDRLGSCSVVLSPAVALPALRHGASKDLGVMGSYSILWNLLGWPAGVVPWTHVGADEETVRPPTRDAVLKAARNTELGSTGLPIGVQLSARPWNDHVVLATMSAVERARQVLASNRPDSIANNVAPARVDTCALA